MIKIRFTSIRIQIKNNSKEKVLIIMDNDTCCKHSNKEIK